MSYADVTASGPPQSTAEKAAPPLPEIAHDDLDVHSIDSLASTSDDLREVGGVNPLPSYADQQKAEEEAQKAKQAAQKKADEVGAQAKAFGERAEKDAQRLGEQAEKDVKRFADKAGEKLEQVKDAAKKEYEATKKDLGVEDKAEEVEKEAKKAEQWADKNKKNPVVVGNVVVVSALATLLGVGAYRLHKAHALTWKVAGAWAGAVGLFAVGDYFVSQYFFKRYPPK